MLARIALVVALMVSSNVVSAQGFRHDRPSLEQADTNADGRITREEFDATRMQMFAKHDRNGDGYLDQNDGSERSARRGGQRGAQLREHLDHDGDGRISKEEFASAETPLFDNADKNDDDVLDAQELADAKATMKKRMKERRALSR